MPADLQRTVPSSLAAAHLEAVERLREAVLGPPERQLVLSDRPREVAFAATLDELRDLAGAWEAEADRLAGLLAEAEEPRCRGCGLELECPSCGGAYG